MSTAGDRPSKPGPKSSAAEVRSALVEASIDLLAEAGLDPRSLTPTINTVIERSGASRASAYRALEAEDGPQAALDRLVLAEIVRRRTAEADSNRTAEAVLVQIEKEATFFAGTAAQRRAAARRVIRFTAEFNIADAASTKAWPLYLAVASALRTRPEDELIPLREALRIGEERAADRFAGIYEYGLQLMARRLRPGVRYEHIGIAAVAMAEGTYIRPDADNIGGLIPRNTGTDGAEELWSIYAMALESILVHFSEPDPDAEVALDFSVWE